MKEHPFISDWGLNQIIFWLFISPVKSCVGVFRLFLFFLFFSIEPERYAFFRADADPELREKKIQISEYRQIYTDCSCSDS